MVCNRYAWLLVIGILVAAGPAAAKPSDQARKDAASHAARGNSAAAKAAETRAQDRGKAEARQQRNAAAKGRK